MSQLNELLSKSRLSEEEVKSFLEAVTQINEGRVDHRFWPRLVSEYGFYRRYFEAMVETITEITKSTRIFCGSEMSDQLSDVLYKNGVADKDDVKRYINMCEANDKAEAVLAGIEKEIQA